MVSKFFHEFALGNIFSSELTVNLGGIIDITQPGLFVKRYVTK